ncbi:MAG: rhodanese-like domain-containing protein [Bacteroidales bacterium]|jgi:rhodanese-related sulfurtransferase|nr:rhodanese-like domain-containing protein [Bacteroidales bacterium]
MKLYLTIICGLLLCANAKSQSLEIVNAKEASEIVNCRNTINTIIIDGRSDVMYAEKHIKGAINIDAFSDSATTELKKHLETKEIIVYCTNQRRAELLIEKLNELQYNGKIIFIIDGLNTWISLGYETVRD